MKKIIIVLILSGLAWTPLMAADEAKPCDKKDKPACTEKDKAACPMAKKGCCPKDNPEKQCPSQKEQCPAQKDGGCPKGKK